MQKKKEKFLEKIVKKNYNNELELVLENKAFDESAKNLLLSVLYKLETAYKDYEQVKINVMPKDDFLQMIIDVIKNEVNSIKIVKINSPEAEVLKGKTFFVDKKNKEIICYPIERKLLYCLSKICKKDKIIKDKYSLIDKTISDLLLIGNNINTVEPMRDFNGFSWDVVTKDIESVEYNLVYQNLRMLVGAKFLNKWIYNKEFIIDYFENFKNKLEDCYGKEIEEKIIESVSKTSILLDMKYNQDKILKMQKSKSELEQKLQEIENKEEFIQKITKEKKELNKQIKKIDTILNDKKLLQKEYVERNERLSLESKIFSLKVLSKIMKEERDELCLKLDKYNEMLNPKKFVKYEKNLKEKYRYFKIMDTPNLDKSIEDEILGFQKLFLECYRVKIQKARTKQEIANLLIELRYYLNIPYSRRNKINQVAGLKKEIEELTKMLIEKAVQAKVLINILNNKDINYLVLKELFNTKIIDLQSININFTKENGRLMLQLFDENVFDKKVDLGDVATFDLSEFYVRLNKNLKIFIF